jgi:hypothetical protein
MERIGDQSGTMPKTNPMIESTTKDAVQGDKTFGPFHGAKVDPAKGSSAGSLHWIKQRDEIVELTNMQEHASNKLSAGMDIFIKRTSVMEKVCTPYSP